MKTNIAILAAILLLVSSCSKDFLDVPPKSFVSSAEFYATKDNFTQALNGAYQSLHGVYHYAYVMGEMRSDNTHYYYKENDRGRQNVEREDIDGFVSDPINQYSGGKYNDCYEGISRTNVILDRIQGATFDDAAKNEIIGEAKFLRAFYYFELVQYFGGVPLYIHEVTKMSETALPRSTKEEVYNQIIEDAKDAAAKLPAVQSDKGRVTKGSANTLLGYVYMTLKNYSEAQTHLQAVVSSGTYSLLSDYASIFDPKNKNNAESIFEVQYHQGNQGLQSDWTYQFIPALSNTVVITGVVGNNGLIGGWNKPTDDLMSSYEEGDVRKAASIADGYTDADGNFVAMPFVIKYLHAHDNYNNTDDDWMVYRYADVLLLLAECLNDQGHPDQALPYLNQVRTRAGLANATTTDQGQLSEVIAHERRVELAFEDHRWLDLVRTGKAIDVMNAFGTVMKAKYPYLLDRTYQVNENKLIFPIPQTELTLNDQLVQNPGY
ncbi:MAG TPA: RagB/SusD family nutrient uptake outer membrane protein [Sunxiuqinia sp.]|nr:RagB/SusD family nutrient uptake outer membrane protein [Sunxiuqinia sp.]